VLIKQAGDSAAIVINGHDQAAEVTVPVSHRAWRVVFTTSESTVDGLEDGKITLDALSITLLLSSPAA
jgi:pullulanase/glycogen debranching enzyme